MIKQCPNCSKTFKSKGTKRKYCCHECSSLARTGVKFTLEHRQKISCALQGHPVTEAIRQKFAIYSKNKVPWNKGKLNLQQSGEHHWNWGGGVTPAVKLRVGKASWKAIRDLVFRRDAFKCKSCGIVLPQGELNCHHTIPHRISKDDSLSNLVTLCRSCHAKIEISFRKYEAREPRFCRPELRMYA